MELYNAELQEMKELTPDSDLPDDDGALARSLVYVVRGPATGKAEK